MKFFVDECISPTLASYLNGRGYDAVHPRNLGRLGEADHVVFAHALTDDRIIITENACDFRTLAAGVDVHPGLIVLPSVAREAAQGLMSLVLAEILARGGSRPADLLVNAVLTIDETGQTRVEPLP